MTLRSTALGVMLSALATTAHAVPISDFTGLEMSFTATLTGNIFLSQVGPTSGSLTIGAGPEVTGLSANGSGQSLFELDVTSSGLVQLIATNNGNAIDLTPVAYTVALSFADPSVVATGVSGRSDNFTDIGTSTAFDAGTLSLTLRGESAPVNGFHFLSQTGQLASLQMAAEGPEAAVPLPAGLPLLLSGLAAFVFMRRRAQHL